MEQVEEYHFDGYCSGCAAFALTADSFCSTLLLLDIAL
jgi:hypothetical protein